MKLQVIVVAYQRALPLQTLINSFLLQTNPDWEMLVIHDGKTPDDVKAVIDGYDDPRIKFMETDRQYGYYGHLNRAWALKNLDCSPNDFVLITNDDNYYVPKFIEIMFRRIDSHIAMVFCNTVHSHFDYDLHVSEIRENHIDMGAFMVRADVAKRVGFNHVNFSADGLYAVDCLEDCKKKNLWAMAISKPLFVHN